jgi:hypothetical protein
VLHQQAFSRETDLILSAIASWVYPSSPSVQALATARCARGALSAVHPTHACGVALARPWRAGSRSAPLGFSMAQSATYWPRGCRPSSETDDECGFKSVHPRFPCMCPITSTTPAIVYVPVLARGLGMHDPSMNPYATAEEYHTLNVCA